MTQDTGTQATSLLERPDAEAPPVPRKAPPGQRGVRFFWPAVVLILGGLAALTTWTVLQRSAIEDAEGRPSIPSTHDSGIQNMLRQQQQGTSLPSTHDSGIQGMLRQQQSSGSASTHDSGFAPFLRQRGGQPSNHDSWVSRFNQAAPVVPPQHDSGIAAQLKARTADTSTCHKAAPGAGGWQARLAFDC
jgi:hypothetical protein